MPQQSTSRRKFLQASAGLLGGGWLATRSVLLYAAAETAQKSMVEQAAFSHLTAAEAMSLAALSDQIFPPDETPGASELGAVYFLDTVLGGFMASLLPMFQAGVADLDSRAGPGKAFHQLDFDQQFELVKAIEKTQFFGNMHFLTLCGLFALPSYGGNRNKEAWNMIGFEARHVWQHPFGYYDALYAEENSHAGS